MRAPAGVHVIGNGRFAAWVIARGARLMQVWWLQAPGGPRPLTVGFAQAQAYAADTMSIGAVCGRYANRIGHATLTHGGHRWELDRNHPLGHCLLGGRGGFGQRDWSVQRSDGSRVLLRLVSADGDQGFPGRCEAEVDMAWEDDTLCWNARAEVDRPCPLNLVQHSYWNLSAQTSVGAHRLQVDADSHLPVGADELPLPPAPVAGSAWDFRAPTPIGATRLPQLDGALLLRSAPAGELRQAAQLEVDDLALELATDQPLLHLYGGAALQPTQTPLGVTHRSGAGLCLETEGWPNGPALGRARWWGRGDVYLHRMRLRFRTA